MATMFKVGKHEYIIRAPEKIYDRDSCSYVNSREEDEEPHYMYFSDISDIRVEEIHPCKSDQSHFYVALTTFTICF